MKKIFSFCILLIVLVASSTLFACKNSYDYSTHVSNLRYAVYSGNGSKYGLKITSNQTETPFINDGICGINKINFTKIALTNGEIDVTYRIFFNFNNNNYEYVLTPNPVTFMPSVQVEIENFNCHNLAITVFCGSYAEEIIVKSELPENTIDYKTAINYFVTAQKDLIDSYFYNDTFNAELYAKVLVKNQKPYWYIAIADGNKIRAVLIDGFSGEILAMRDIF